MGSTDVRPWFVWNIRCWGWKLHFCSSDHHVCYLDCWIFVFVNIPYLCSSLCFIVRSRFIIFEGEILMFHHFQSGLKMLQICTRMWTCNGETWRQFKILCEENTGIRLGWISKALWWEDWKFRWSWKWWLRRLLPEVSWFFLFSEEMMMISPEYIDWDSINDEGSLKYSPPATTGVCETIYYCQDHLCGSWISMNVDMKWEKISPNLAKKRIFPNCWCSFFHAFWDDEKLC